VSGLRVVPLGGLGEIGLNLLVLETPEGAVAVDCGVMFPDEQMLGVDVVIPDVSYLRSIRDRFRGIFLTHGHEDHIGALPYVLTELDVPVYGTPLTLGFVRERLREHGLSRDLRLLAPGQTQSVGAFGVEPFVMTHSIPDAVGLAVRTPFGTVVHTGDFKLDQTPLDGRLPDLARLAALGDEGVLLLLSDSTNVEHAGVTPSERSVGAHLDALFAEAKGRIVVTTVLVAHPPHAAGDRLVGALRTQGRVRRPQPQAHTAWRASSGLLHLRDDQVIDLADVRNVRPHELTLISAGSQAEAASALMRIAMDAHKQVQLDPGDTVIFSSRVIPGNERAIANLVNHLYRRGAIVHYGHAAPIHVSGHASQEELKLVLNLVRPKFFVPVHGEYRHLVRHNLLAGGGRACVRRTAICWKTATCSSSTRTAPRRAGRWPPGACSSTARASATSTTSCCATAAISRRAGSCSPCWAGAAFGRAGCRARAHDAWGHGRGNRHGGHGRAPGPRSWRPSMPWTPSADRCGRGAERGPAGAAPALRRLDRRPVILPFVIEM
jgi:ribonuclease J